MRKLHPSGPHERLLAQGTETTPAGLESWTVHEGPAGRRVLRVESGENLWHAVIDDSGSPERVQVRNGAEHVDATFTFFEDEVLVWRRGAAPPAESVPLPGRCVLGWPALACRAHLLAHATPADAPADGPVVVFTVRLMPKAEGGVAGSVEAGSVRRVGGAASVAPEPERAEP